MQWTLFSAVILFTSNTIADVLVQPGYGQPQPIVQPASTYQQALNKDGQVQPDTYDPGYHLELHPVYAGAPQVPADPTVSYSLLQHQLTPYLSKSAQRRLNSGKLGDLGVMGLPLGVPAALSHQYLPLCLRRTIRNFKR
ncbi:uncharacterized protein LOC143187108 [Calliopsis andreniformis]|uniref:uncharacterized protein LOC143187108 n=1 Tax=Calliopsis andreniformis TaxID=337506 RepID=UPI003FCE406E